MPPIRGVLAEPAGITRTSRIHDWAIGDATRQQDAMMGIGVPGGLPSGNLGSYAATLYIQGSSKTFFQYWIDRALDFLKQLASLNPLAKGATN